MEWIIFGAGLLIGAAITFLGLSFRRDRYWREYLKFREEFERENEELAEQIAETSESIKSGARRTKDRFKL